MDLPQKHTEPDYEKAELDLLRDALKKTHEERFFTMTKLMKRSLMLRNAKIDFSKSNTMKEEKNIFQESQPVYGFVNKSENQKLLDEWNRPLVDKIQSFTKMLKRNKALRKTLSAQNDSHGCNG